MVLQYLLLGEVEVALYRLAVHDDLSSKQNFKKATPMKKRGRKSAPITNAPMKDFDKANFLGSIIYVDRLEKNLTQDEYGQVYGVTGPAIFKIEKGYIRPSLGLWLRIAEHADCPISYEGKHWHSRVSLDLTTCNCT